MQVYMQEVPVAMMSWTSSDTASDQDIAAIVKSASTGQCLLRQLDSLSLRGSCGTQSLASWSLLHSCLANEHHLGAE
jgi:hypothetical protein